MSISPRLRVVAAEPPELVVYDEPGPCSYIVNETWRLPLRLPVRTLSREEFGLRLAEGDRRQGRLLYRTACASCSACEPIRLDVEAFRPSRTQRRVFNRAEGRVRTALGPIGVSEERVDLYNRHKHGRDLAAGEAHASLESYRSFLGETCCESFEMRYRVGDDLLGVAIVDRADDALSAVYFYWEPGFEALSPGVFSIMKQVELCRRMGLRYLYLGLFIAQCPPMSYKSSFMPNERLIDGRWQTFKRG
jgi:arginyl-tRNA--protein-N-Asp/Glu arginylyltransferase